MDWRDAKPLLERLLDLPEGERDAALSREPDVDEDLRHRLAGVLAAGRAGRGLLEPPPTSAGPRAGDRIGSWRLVEPLGEGGMGRVWLAERAGADFRQRGALKLVKPGMDTDSVLRRLRRERRLLAELDHPGIVRLLDGGATAEGRPFLVLEQVEGSPIDAHCAERALNVDARVELFARVCDAVAAAHELGVVHRDLKPNNVLVTADGDPKVLDFGIAKVLGAEDGPEASLLTRTGERLLTPRYAAPEQMRGEACTPATDVHALGVLLYELLTGRPPYDTTGSTSSAIESAVCEETPRRPSRASTRELRRRLAGDLDVIVLRALAKEPARRYRDAGHLAQDLRRHLAHEPIRARPDTALYRATKFVRRHRVLVAAASAVLIALTAGLAESERQRRIAAERADDAEWSAYVSQVRHHVANLRAEVELGALGHEGPAELRGWEWRHLRALGRHRGRVLSTSSGSTRLALDGRGERLAFVDGEEGVVVSTSDGREQARMPTGAARRLALSEDGRLSAWGVAEEVIVLELGSRAELARWTASGSVNGLAFVPGRKALAFADRRGVALWSWAELTPPRRLLDVWGDALAVAPGGDRLALAGRDGRVHVAGIDDPTLDVALDLDAFDEFLVAVAFSADGRLVAAATDSGVARVWDLAERRPVTIPLRTGQYCTSIAFRADRDQLLVPGSTLRAWDLASGRDHTLHGMSTTIRHLVAHPSRPRCYTSFRDGRILEWDVAEAPVPRHRLTEGWCRDVSATPDGGRCVVSIEGASASLLRVDAGSGEVLATRGEALGSVADLVHLPSGDVVCAASSGLLLLDGDDLGTLAEWDVPGATCVALDAGGLTVRVGTADGRVLRLRTSDGATLEERATPLDEVRRLALDPGGRGLAVAGREGQGVHELDLDRGEWSSFDPDVAGDVLALAFDPEGRWLAVGGGVGLQVRSRGGGPVLYEREHSQVKAARFTRDGSRLLYVSNSYLVVVDTARWSEVVRFRESDRGIQGMDLAADGTVFTSDWAGDVCVFRAAAPE